MYLIFDRETGTYKKERKNVSKLEGGGKEDGRGKNRDKKKEGWRKKGRMNKQKEGKGER